MLLLLSPDSAIRKHSWCYNPKYFQFVSKRGVREKVWKSEFEERDYYSISCRESSCYMPSLFTQNKGTEEKKRGKKKRSLSTDDEKHKGQIEMRAS